MGIGWMGVVHWVDVEFVFRNPFKFYFFLKFNPSINNQFNNLFYDCCEFYIEDQRQLLTISWNIGHQMDYFFLCE